MRQHSQYFASEGLILRPVEEADLPTVRLLRNDWTTWMNLTDPRAVSDADQKAWLASIGIRAGRFYFVACDEGNPFIGLVRMDEHDALNRSIRVGADVLQELRGRGHGGRIYAAIKEYCFDILNVHRVWLAVLETNHTAMRLYERQGFVVEGRYRGAVFRGGRYVDYVLMSILEEEYRKSKEKGPGTA